MSGVLRPDLGNALMIGGIAFLAVFLIDRGLRAAGYGQFSTSGS